MKAYYKAEMGHNFRFAEVKMNFNLETKYLNMIDIRLATFQDDFTLLWNYQVIYLKIHNN